MFDLCVVGAGLFGSSAAKHAAKIAPGLKICLVGPPEPQVKEKGRIFGSWFDAGRLYALLHHSPAWAELAKESISRFGTIKEESGEDFYKDVGYLEAATEAFGGLPEFHEARDKLLEQGFDCVKATGESVGQVYPCLALPKDSCVHYQPAETKKAGYLNPRQLVKAQQKIAGDRGCEIVQDLVVKITPETQEGDAGDVTGVKSFLLECQSGRVLRARKILITCGIYTGLLSLVREATGGKFDLNLRYMSQVVALMEMSDQMKAKLSSMPTMVTFFDRSLYTYILPPVDYPDGKSYLKFGCHDRTKDRKSLDEVTDYFVDGPNAEKVEGLVRFAKEIIPGLEVSNVVGMNCVTSYTPTKMAPFIDTIADGVTVAAGCCGEGAATCEEIGRIAANLALNKTWDSRVPRDMCRADLIKH